MSRIGDIIEQSNEPADNKPKFPDDFDIDCGACGVKILWSDFAVNDYKCPYCGWDIIRVSPKRKD